MISRVSNFLVTFALLSLFETAVSGQVQPINAVGYINIGLSPGFTLVSKQLREEGFTVADLRKGIQGAVPSGLRIYLFEQGGFKTVSFNQDEDSFEPADFAAEAVSPGGGFFVYNPSSNFVTLTIVGEVPQGRLTNALPQGFSLVSSMVPVQGTLEVLKFPAAPGDLIYLWNALTQSFEMSYFDDIDGKWIPTPREIQTGESFFVWKRQPALWVREFSVIGPQSVSSVLLAPF